MNEFFFINKYGKKILFEDLPLIYKKFYLNSINSEIKVFQDKEKLSKIEKSTLDNYKKFFNENKIEELERADFSNLYSHDHQGDAGQLLLKPKLTILKKCLTFLVEKYVREKLPEINEIESPNLYDTSISFIQDYLTKFPARYYEVKNNKKEFALRFAACPNHFYYAKKNYLTEKQLPLYLFEMADCYRLEQTGELQGLKRVRKFLMQDCHIFTEENKELVEFFIILKHIKIFLKKLNLIDLCVPTVRCSREYYKINKRKLNKVAKIYNSPVFFEIWDTQKYYFQVKFEMNSMVNLHESQLSTVQLDNVLPKTYNLNYFEKGEKKDLKALHMSLIGSLERLIEVMLRVGLPDNLQYPRILVLTEGAPSSLLQKNLKKLSKNIPIEVDSRKKDFYNRRKELTQKNENLQIISFNKSEIIFFSPQMDIVSYRNNEKVLLKFKDLLKIKSFYKELGSFYKTSAKQL